MGDRLHSGQTDLEHDAWAEDISIRHHVQLQNRCAEIH